MQQIMLPSIWATSPCTLPFVNRSASFQKSRRFEFNSIYYKDDPFKPKNQQNPLSRPQIVLNEFRKKIKEATKSFHGSGQFLKKKSSDLEDKRFQTVNPRAANVTNRLYEQPHQTLEMKYDSNGNRSSFFQHKNKNEKQNLNHSRSISPKDLKLMKLKVLDSDNVYITSTPRTDFSRPLNFHPGPGSYLLQNQQLQKLSILRSKHSGKSSLNTFDGKSTKSKKSSFEGKSVFDSKSQFADKSFDEKKGIRFETLDSSELPQQRSNAFFHKRILKNAS